MEPKPEIYFPEEIAAEILFRLPAKSLVRFTVVCKSWYSLIRNPSFIATHLNRNLSKEGDSCFLNVSDHRCTVISENTLTVRAKFELPYDFSETKILSLCKGLICLNIIYGAGQGIFLYNPSIQHLKIVESFRGSELNSLPYIHYGFGYHEPSNDHRLVKLLDFPTKKVEIYSLKTDSWRELQLIPPGKRLGHWSNMAGLYFDGATHWLTCVEIEVEIYVLDSIVAFDLSEEVFRDIELPSELQVDIDDFVHINEFEGSLAILVSNNLSSICSYLDLWVMGEYGVSESWNKKFSIPLSDMLQPRGFTKNGSVVLRNGNGSAKHRSLSLYNLQKRQYRDSEDILGVKDIFDCTDSLILLDHENFFWKYQSCSNLFYWNF